ncbi:MAG: MFS transporter, partial [Actinomycetota bacterium]
MRVFLIAIAIGFNFALIGPIATRLSGAFDVGLGEVGILTTALLVTHALSQLPAAEPAQRIGPLKLVRLSFVLVTAANLVAMVSPAFWLLAVTRLVVGCGTGPVFVGGLDGTRRLGGPFLAGVFGGAATLGLGIALLVGGIYDDLG